MEPIKKVKFLVIHHSQRSRDFPAFIRWRHTKKRGWEDIGYHFLIGNGKLFTKNGKIYKGRKEFLVGAHVYGFNKNSLGICLIGNFDYEYPTKKQIRSLILLLNHL